MSAKKPATHDLSADDAPELDDAFFERATVYEGDRVVRRGRPPLEVRRPTLNMRIDAVRTLGQLAYAPAYQPILALAKSDRWELREVVATALAAFDADKNAETLIDLLCDREWWVRYRAAESLLCCSDPDDVVRRVAAREDRFAREMMQFALDKQYLRTRKGAA